MPQPPPPPGPHSSHDVFQMGKQGLPGAIVLPPAPHPCPGPCGVMRRVPQMAPHFCAPEPAGRQTTLLLLPQAGKKHSPVAQIRASAFPRGREPRGRDCDRGGPAGHRCGAGRSGAVSSSRSPPPIWPPLFGQAPPCSASRHWKSVISEVVGCFKGIRAIDRQCLAKQKVRKESRNASFLSCLRRPEPQNQ